MKKDDSSLIMWAFVIGLPIYLLMEHPVIFWLAFVPLAVSFVVTLVKWLQSGKASLSGLFSAIGILVAILVLAIVVCR